MATSWARDSYVRTIRTASGCRHPALQSCSTADKLATEPPGVRYDERELNPRTAGSVPTTPGQGRGSHLMPRRSRRVARLAVLRSEARAGRDGAVYRPTPDRISQQMQSE